MIETGEKINCEYYITHLNLPENKSKKEIKEDIYNKFTENTIKNLKLLFDRSPVKEKFLIENTDFNIKYLDHFLYNYGLNLCLDIGHLVLQKENIISTIEHYAEKIKLIHLHGINEQKEDHKGLNYFNQDELNKILIACKKTNAEFLVIEVFDEKSFFNSYKLLNLK